MPFGFTTAKRRLPHSILPQAARHEPKDGVLLRFSRAQAWCFSRISGLHNRRRLRNQMFVATTPL